MMKELQLLFKSKHKLKDVYSFLVGNIRYKFPWLMRTFIREQILYRVNSMKHECLENGACIVCGCDTPKLAYSNKACEGYCYPRILIPKEWKVFKRMIKYDGQGLNVLIFKFEHNNVWNIQNQKFTKIMWDTEKQDLGIIQPRSSHMLKFYYWGNSKKKPNVQSSCGCTNAVWNKDSKTITVIYTANKLKKDKIFRKGQANVKITFPEESTYKLDILFEIRRK